MKDEFHKSGFDIAVIPGGCTKYLQPLDLTVNRSFKCKLKSMWKPAVSTERVSCQLRLQRLIGKVKDAVGRVSSECIKNGFRTMHGRPDSLFTLY